MWTLFVSAALGIWLMVSPAVLGYGGAAADVSHIAGPIAASLAIIAIWEATRSVRLVNLPLGLGCVVAPFVLGYDLPAALNSVVVGILLVALAPFGGKLKQRFGGGWRSLWSSSAEEDTR